MFARTRFLVSTKLIAARALVVKVAVEGGVALVAWRTGMSNDDVAQTLIWYRQWLTVSMKRCLLIPSLKEEVRAEAARDYDASDVNNMYFG